MKQTRYLHQIVADMPYYMRKVCIFKTNYQILSIVPITAKISGLDTGGKPSTWYPPGRLVEHIFHKLLIFYQWEGFPIDIFFVDFHYFLMLRGPSNPWFLQRVHTKTWFLTFVYSSIFINLRSNLAPTWLHFGRILEAKLALKS